VLPSVRIDRNQKEKQKNWGATGPDEKTGKKGACTLCDVQEDNQKGFPARHRRLEQEGKNYGPIRLRSGRSEKTKACAR